MKVGQSILSVGFCISLFLAHSASAGESVGLPPIEPPIKDQWELSLDVYGWGAGINADFASGGELGLSFDNILDSLEMTVMAGFSAKKGPWTIGSDIIYLDVGGQGRRYFGARDESSLHADLDLKAWILNPTVGYRVSEGGWGNLELVAGARYLYLKEETSLTTTTPLGTTSSHSSESNDAWAGIVGFRGQIRLAERWFLPFYADVGGGDPNLTWQAFAGVGYRFDSFDLIAGYRYLDWDLDSTGSISDMNVSGALLGVKFSF